MAEAAASRERARLRLDIRRFTAFDHRHPVLGGLLYTSGVALTGALAEVGCRRLRVGRCRSIRRVVAVAGGLLLWDRVVSHGIVKRRVRADVTHTASGP